MAQTDLAGSARRCKLLLRLLPTLLPCFGGRRLLRTPLPLGSWLRPLGRRAAVSVCYFDDVAQAELLRQLPFVLMKFLQLLLLLLQRLLLQWVLLQRLLLQLLLRLFQQRLLLQWLLLQWLLLQRLLL